MSIASKSPTCPTTGTAGHTTRASSMGWELWRHVVCRSAGFPSSRVLEFGDRECAKAADELNVRRAQEESAWKELRDAVKPRIDELRQRLREMPVGDPRRSDLAQTLASFQALAKSVYKRDLAKLPRHPDVAPQREHLDVARRAHDAAHEAFMVSYAKAIEACAIAARRLADDGRFREAVAWQNPNALATAVECLRVGDVPTGARSRNAVALVATYAQRYCTKNDMIGFFGPCGWAEFVDDDIVLSATPGAGLLARRRVYFEDWAVRAVASRLGSTLALRPWLTPRLAAHLRWDGARLHWPGGRTVVLAEAEAAVLQSCDGIAMTAEIAAALCANPFLSFSTPADVEAIVARLTEERRLDCSLGVRAGDAFAERHLRRQLERIGDADLRASSLAEMDTLDDARIALEAAAGDADAVVRAIDRLNDEFERSAGVAATRHAGQTYGARTVAYEDCIRHMKVALGTRLRKELQPPLDLILSSARWFCHELALHIRSRLTVLFNELASGNRSGAAVTAFDFPTFWYAAQEMFFGTDDSVTKDLQHELCSRWGSILGPMGPGAAASFRSEDLRSSVDTLFAAPSCGWPAAMHQSPDVMIVAGRGAPVYVLGELHMGTNTLLAQATVHQHAEPDVLVRALRDDWSGPRLMPLLSPHATRQPIRVQSVVDAGRDIEICFSADSRPLDPSRAVSIGDLLVEADGDGRVHVRSADGRHHFELEVVFGEFLSTLAINCFRLLEPRAHTPRITVDSLVVQRETWRIPCSEVAGALEPDEALAFVQARRWASDVGLPRWIFVKTPWEDKPFYADLASPVYVAALLKQVRNAARRGTPPQTLITVSEMLPLHADHWLPDADGDHYSCELRIAAVHSKDRLVSLS